MDSTPREFLPGTGSPDCRDADLGSSVAGGAFHTIVGRGRGSVRVGFDAGDVVGDVPGALRCDLGARAISCVAVPCCCTAAAMAVRPVHSPMMLPMP